MKKNILLLVVLSLMIATPSCKKDKEKDVTAPVITLLGSNPVAAEKGQPYVDAGASASDDVDGDISSRIVVTNPVDPNTEGTYIVRYNVTDDAGNKAAEVTRTVNVMIF